MNDRVISKLGIRPISVVACFLAFHLLLAYWDPLCMWGTNILAYSSNATRSLFLIFSLILIVPHVRTPLINGLVNTISALDPWRSTRSVILTSLALAVVGGLLFFVFRSALHLLGDGYLLLRDLTFFNPRVTWKGVNAPLSYWTLKAVYESAPGSIQAAPQIIYRVWSATSGVIYILLAVRVAGTLGQNAAERLITLGFLLSAGFLQLFFGYVETYAILLPVTLLYLWTGSQVLQGRLPLWVPAAVLGVLFPLHFVTVTLAPSLILLAIQSSDPASNSPKRSRTMAVAMNGLVIGIAPILALLVLGLIGFSLHAYTENVRPSHLLSVFGQDGPDQPYPIISPAHILALFNQYLLVAPAALITICLIQRGKLSLDPIRTFFLVATIFPVAFTCLVNPEIGAFRDWDALAFSALPFTLWSARFVIARSRQAGNPYEIGTLIFLAVGLHTAFWIGLNARPESAIGRFSDLLQRTQLSPSAQSYGWETLGRHYLDHNEIEKASAAYRGALEAIPENPRHWSSLGNCRLKLQQYEEALNAYRRSIELDPDFVGAYANVGSVFFITGDFEKAVEYYQKSVSIQPAYADGYYNMGNAFNRLSRYEEAIQAYEKTVALNSNHARGFANLGNASSSLGQIQRAISSYQKAIEIEPDFEEAYYNLGIAYLDIQQIETARALFEKVLILNPDFSKAAAIKKWREENPP